MATRGMSSDWADGRNDRGTTKAKRRRAGGRAACFLVLVDSLLSELGIVAVKKIDEA